MVLAPAALAGCPEPPPPPPSRDGGARPDDAGDGAGLDAGPFVGLGRPDGGARLPPADLEVVLPYLGPEVTDPLEIEGEVGRLDVFFAIDTTGSFEGEIDNLQADLRRRIVPALRDRVTDVAFGVGRFEDFPIEPFGRPSDRPFTLLAPITDDDARVSSAVASLDQPLGDGADIPESGAEALYQIATGEGLGSFVTPFASAASARGALGDEGGVGFRADALRVVVLVTDAPTHSPEQYRGFVDDAHSLDEAIAELSSRAIRTLGVASGPAARPYLERVAAGTGALLPLEGARCATGVNGGPTAPRDGACPLVFDINADGTGLADAVVDAIADLLSTVQHDEVYGETDDRLGFVRAIEAVEAIPPSGVPAPASSDLRPADGIADTFEQVRPGTQLRFVARLRNETIPPADYDQIFNLVIRLVGDGITLLSRRVRVIVPRGRLDAGVGDAGPNDAGPNDAGPNDAGPNDAGANDAG